MSSAFRIILAFICIAGVTVADESPNWNVDGVNQGWRNDFIVLKYLHNSELQRQWVWHLLGRHRFTGNERILDFGCGDGKITAEVSHFIPEGYILGVDSSPTMIAVASRCFPTVYYPNLAFQQNTDVNLDEIEVANKYDVIFSFCVFHLVPDAIRILKNLRSHLSPSGQLMLVIPSGHNAALFQAASEMFNKYKIDSPWGAKGAAPKMTMRTKEGCAHCLAEAGFQVIGITEMHTPTMFFNRQELIEWMVGTMSANWQVPVEQAAPFFNELVDRMVELDSEVKDKSGGYSMKLSRLEVIAKGQDK